MHSVYAPAYHEALFKARVVGYEYEQLLNDYGFALLNLLQHFIVVLSVVDFVRTYSLELIRLIIGRMVIAANDAGCSALVGRLASPNKDSRILAR